MIAIAAQNTKSSTADDWKAKFVELLPTIRSQAHCAFRDEPPERREELVAEVTANCWAAYVRLIERGLSNAIYPTPLTQYAIRQVRSGRKVGGKLNVRDISSRYCQRAKGVVVERLDRYDSENDEWREVLVEDHRATPADIAATRIDFGDWLRSLPRRSRRIAETLARGERTRDVAKRFAISAGRVSQIRDELRRRWLDFQGQLDGVAVAAS